MSWQYTPLIYSMTASLLLMLSLATYTAYKIRRQGGNQTHYSFLVFLIGSSLFTLFYLAQTISTELDMKILFGTAMTVSTTLLVLGWVVFAFNYTGRTDLTRGRNLVLLSVIPVLTIIVAVTNEWHGLLWSNQELISRNGLVIIERSFGPWVWVYAGYGYTVGLLGLFMLIAMAIRSASIYRGQALALVVGALAPILPSIAFLFGASPQDHSPSGFALSGLAFWFAVYRFRFLNIIPIARKAVVESMKDPYLVFDERNTLVDFNSAAEEILDFEPGSKKSKVMLDILQGEGSNPNEVVLDTGVYQVDSTSIKRNNRELGELVMLRDITDIRRREEELRYTNRRLERFAEVVTHDLRNPLSIAMAQLSLVKEGGGDIEKVEDAHERIQAIINDVLSLTRKEDLELNEISMRDVAMEAWSQIDTGSARLNVDNLVVVADRERLQRLLENLFRNSVEHAEKDKGHEYPEELEVQVEDTDQGFMVRDNGEGFADPGMLLESGTEVGLGLSIVREIAHAHGWGMDLRNEGGAVVEFSFDGDDV